MDLQPSIAANTPYIMRLCPERSACSIKFSATGVKVNSTNDEIKKEGNDYTLFASFGTTDAPASTSYVLDEDGARFVKNTEAEAVAEGSDENASSTISIAPFSVYAVSEKRRFVLRHQSGRYSGRHRRHRSRRLRHDIRTRRRHSCDFSQPMP